MTRLLLLAALLALASCAEESANELPPLPKETAESANALMREAENAAANAQVRLRQQPPPQPTR